jgi:hypothetical protein
LKKRGRWRREVTAGVRFIHVNFNDDDQTWGPHLHCILQTKDLKANWLGNAWNRITAGSWDVWVGPQVDGVNKIKTIYYAAKYPYKQFEDDPSLIGEYEKAIKGKRTAQAFGNWYGRLRLSGKPHPRS